jgi:predicted house-cleaning noncanonical NTP pyrophosphatase (MazG superfamily)
MSLYEKIEEILKSIPIERLPEVLEAVKQLLKDEGYKK